MSKPKPCKHGRYFCMECHYGQEGDFKTLPEMYDALAAENTLLREALTEVMHVMPCLPPAGKLIDGMSARYEAAVKIARTALVGSKEQADE